MNDSIFIPDEFLENNGIDGKDYQLLFVIDRFQELTNDNDTGWCLYSKDTLAKSSGIHRTNLIARLNKLVKKGFVKRNKFIPRILQVTPKFYAEKSKYTIILPIDKGDNMVV